MLGLFDWIRRNYIDVEEPVKDVKNEIEIEEPVQETVEEPIKPDVLEDNSNFIKWVQQRLNVHGFNVDIDGDWGRRSINALKGFQSQHGLAETGVTTNETVNALKKAPFNKGKVQNFPEFDNKEKMPPWMAEMHRRMGLHEVRNNAELIKFLRIGKYLGNPKDLPWCGDAVESCIAKTLPTEPLPSNPFWAQGWNKFGINVNKPIVGSIGVIRWSSKAGHVGFVCGYDNMSNTVYLLGGNQSNAINIRGFKKSKFIGFRWPTTYPVKAYPALKADSIGFATETSTR